MKEARLSFTPGSAGQNLAFLHPGSQLAERVMQAKRAMKGRDGSGLVPA